MKRLLTISLLLILLPIVGAQDGTDSGMQVQDSQDFVWAVYTGDNFASASQNIFVRELKDLNSDGDFADAGENDLFITITDGLCSASGHLSCIEPDDGNYYVIWRNASSRHVVGNYSFLLTMENGLGQVIARGSTMVRIVPDLELKSEARRDHADTRALINQSYSNSTLLEHQQTRSLINQSYSNMSQNLSYMNTTGVFCLNCSSGDTLNHTEFRNSISDLCHGTDYCLHNHVSNPVSDETWRTLAVIAAFGIATLLAMIRRPIVPYAGILMGIAIVFVLTSNTTIVSNKAAFQALSAIAIVPFGVAAWNLLETRKAKREADSY